MSSSIKSLIILTIMLGIGRCPARWRHRLTQGISHPGNSSPISPSGKNVRSSEPLPGVLVTTTSSDFDEVCACGRKCKGRRGLNAHQRSRGFFKSLTRWSSIHKSESQCCSSSAMAPTRYCVSPTSQDPTPDTLTAKPVLRLPKSKDWWTAANAYFHSLFSTRLSLSIIDLDKEVQIAQDEGYNYFFDTYGSVPVDNNSGFTCQYVDLSIN